LAAYLSLALPPPWYDTGQLLNNICKMCTRFAMPGPLHPSRSNNTITMTANTTTTTIADSCQAIVLPDPACSNPQVCHIPLPNATITNPDKETTVLMTMMMTTTIHNDDDAMTMTKMIILINDNDDDDATTTALTTIPDTDATTTTTPENDDPLHATTICTPWLRDSFSLVLQATDHLAAAIANMSSAIAELSMHIDATQLSNLTPDFPTPLRHPTILLSNLKPTIPHWHRHLKWTCTGHPSTPTPASSPNPAMLQPITSLPTTSIAPNTTAPNHPVSTFQVLNCLIPVSVSSQGVSLLYPYTRHQTGYRYLVLV